MTKSPNTFKDRRVPPQMRVAFFVFFLAISALFLFPIKTDASGYCYLKATGEIVRCEDDPIIINALKCKPPDTPDCIDNQSCAAESSDKSCKDLLEPKGCCFCGAGADLKSQPGVATGKICLDLCKGKEPTNYIPGSDCNDAKALEYKKQAAGTTTPTPAAEPLPTFKMPEYSVPTLLGRIIRAILGITGSLALASIIYGGFLWLTSGGSPERITKAKNVIIWAVLGLVIVFASYAIVSAIFAAVGQTFGTGLVGG